MDEFLKNYKGFLAEHYVFDTWQFIVNARNNIIIAGFCYKVVENLISKMSEEHNEWLESFNKDLTFISFGYDNLPKYKMDVAGTTVDYPFLIDKNIKDFFQYIRNGYDSMPQIINSALLANEAIPIDHVDFAKIACKFKEDSYQQKFPKTSVWINYIINSNEYSYISGFNNRVKHISDVKIIMSQSLFHDDFTNEIDAFYKKKQFTEQDIIKIMKSTLDFTEHEFISILNILKDEIGLNENINGRIHNLHYYSQVVEDDPKSSFTVVYIEVDSSIDELPNILRILLVSNKDGDVCAVNCDYDEILVLDKNGKCLGKFNPEKPILDHEILCYRKYEKIHCNGIEAFINHASKDKIIYPFYMSGKIVRVENDELIK